MDAQLDSLSRAKFAKSKITADQFEVRVQHGIARWTFKRHTAPGRCHAGLQDCRSECFDTLPA
jgi:hypothetical protein